MKAKLVAFVAVVTVTGLLAGCTASRNGLGTRDSDCFRVYPDAMAAVHGHGRFAGERYLPPRALIIELQCGPDRHRRRPPTRPGAPGDGGPRSDPAPAGLCQRVSKAAIGPLTPRLVLSCLNPAPARPQLPARP